MTFEAGQIVAVPFPFADRPGAKMRPALVLSTRQYNAATKHLIVCTITSNLADSAFSILVKPSDAAGGRIPKASRVKVDRIFCVHEGQVERTYGKLKAAAMDQVWKEFHSLFPA